MSAYTEGKKLSQEHSEQDLEIMRGNVSRLANGVEAFTGASQQYAYDFHVISAAILFKQGKMDQDATRFFKRK